MTDGVIGSIIVVIGFAVATILALVKASRKEKRNVILSILFVIWMIACALFMVYHFLC